MNDIKPGDEVIVNYYPGEKFIVVAIDGKKVTLEGKGDGGVVQFKEHINLLSKA